MEVQYDHYFWLAFGYIAAALGVLAAIIWIGLRCKRFGKVVVIAAALVATTYDLTQCTSIVAYQLRKIDQSKNQQ